MPFTLEQVLKSKTSSVIHSVASSETVQNAAIKMADNGIGALLVIDNQQVVGIFTERDIVNKLFKACLNPCETKVSDLMTRELIFGKLSTTLAEAMATFTQYHFRHLPIIEGNRLHGMVSIGDITKWVLTNQEKELTYLTEYIRGETYY
ncbi:MAG: CBS domain-containing protein [Legionellales bacterium]|nr:CBS domain-containing protein [Legionellales bacterium]